MPDDDDYPEILTGPTAAMKLAQPLALAHTGLGILFLLLALLVKCLVLLNLVIGLLHICVAIWLFRFVSRAKRALAQAKSGAG